MYVFIKNIKDEEKMSKKTRRTIVWVMLFIMVASVIAGVLAYFI